ncbi:MAG: flagellar biosynthesis protein FlhF [Oscillospiraceae bacterium]|jgi:flagellar biosynthesis protein FlhF|nr:flagellar biosynthesis protein FlhF [Oscillospiraceae bacterium]
MNVKRYIADSPSEALDKVRAELGSDAYILQQRSIRRKGLRGLFQKPTVEITAAYEPDKKPAPPPAPPPLRTYKPAPAPAPAAPAPEPQAYVPHPYVPYPPAPAALAAQRIPESQARQAALDVLERLAQKQHVTEEDSGFRPLSITQTADPKNQKLTALEDKIDTLATTITTLAGKLQLSTDTMRAGLTPEMERYLVSLIDNDVNSEFARSIAREASDIQQKHNAPADEVLEQLLRQSLGEPSPVRLKRFKRSVVVLAGPTGVGKTTTLAKLSAVYMLNHHAKVGLVTADTYRIAATEQLKTYAELLEIPLSVIYTPSEITDALKDHQDKDVVFIDTAGKSPGDATLEEDLATLIRCSDCDEVHLVISATTGFSGLMNIINNYNFLRDYKLLFTKLDETPSWGTILNARFISDKPISYLAFGQSVPDDIEVMPPRKIIAKLMGTRYE